MTHPLLAAMREIIWEYRRQKLSPGDAFDALDALANRHESWPTQTNAERLDCANTDSEYLSLAESKTVEKSFVGVSSRREGIIKISFGAWSLQRYPEDGDDFVAVSYLDRAEADKLIEDIKTLMEEWT